MIHCFPSVKARSLNPDDLRIASDAFEAALVSLDGTSSDPRRVRELLARFILERAFEGERDADRLRAAALEHVRLTVRKIA
jgi:hypothetical protein